MRPRRWCASARLRPARPSRRLRRASRLLQPAIAASQSGAGSDGGGTFKPASNCPSALPGSFARKKDDAEIDVGGGGRRQQRDGALQADARRRQLPVLAQGGAEERVAGAGRRIEPHALAQLGQRSSPGAAVPEGDAEVVMRVG